MKTSQLVNFLKLMATDNSSRHHPPFGSGFKNKCQQNTTSHHLMGLNTEKS